MTLFNKPPKKIRKPAMCKTHNCFLMLAVVLAINILGNISGANAQYEQSDSERQKKIIIDRIHKYHEMRATSPQGREPLVYVNGRPLGNNPQLRAQIDIERTYGKEISKLIGYDIDTEPTIPQIQFYKAEEAHTLGQRVDKLLHGVTVILPPQYDMYGYEIRRYMSSIAGEEVLSDPHRLAKEVANSQRAEIILEHWDKIIRAEIKEIETILETDETVDPTMRNNFKFKSGKAKAFLIEADSWISNNKKMLEMLFDARNKYEYIEPRINFASEEDAKKFLNLFRARQKSLEIMHEYPPFRAMIY